MLLLEKLFGVQKNAPFIMLLLEKLFGVQKNAPFDDLCLYYIQFFTRKSNQ